MKSKLVTATIVVGILSSCATKPSDIDAAYVSPTLYSNLSCDQLKREATEVSARAIAASGAQEKKATNDAVAVGVGLVLFWPALFFAKGDGAQAAEVSRLKGEMLAIERASKEKNCGIQFQTQAPAKKA